MAIGSGVGSLDAKFQSSLLLGVDDAGDALGRFENDMRPGDRVVSSGDGGMFPAGLLVGQVVLGNDRRLRVSLSADYQRLEFLRVLRSHELAPITDAGALVAPPLLPDGPDISGALNTDVLPTRGNQPEAEPAADASTETDGNGG